MHNSKQQQRNTEVKIISNHNKINKILSHTFLKWQIQVIQYSNHNKCIIAYSRLCFFIKPWFGWGLQFLQHSKDALRYFVCAEQTQVEKNVWGVLRRNCWAVFQETNECIYKCSLPYLNQENDLSVVYKSAGQYLLRSVWWHLCQLDPTTVFFSHLSPYRDIKNAWWGKEAASALISSPLP